MTLFAIFSFLFMLWAFSGSTHMLDMSKLIPSFPFEGEICTTIEGRNGFLMERESCEKLNHSSTPKSSSDDVSFTESTVCCILLSKSEENDSHKQKRQATAPSSDIPNLRVKGCGIRSSLRDFIVGGKEAEFWPWMASVYVKSKGAKTSRFICGGVVINKHFILTAAHCLGERRKSVKAPSVSIRVGSLRHSKGTSIPVRKVIVHENYRNDLHYDDIALLKTSRDIAVKNVVPVCLPSPGMYNSNFFQRQATVIGWGDISYGGTPSPVLLEATLPVIPNKRCDTRYKRLSPLSLPQGIIDKQICAGAENGSTDACQGDSGGPLLLEDQSKKWNVIGIVSFGYRCGEPEYPGVYTKVAKYLKWLQSHTDIAPRLIS